jgi:hypothetical protein
MLTAHHVIQAIRSHLLFLNYELVSAKNKNTELVFKRKGLFVELSENEFIRFYSKNHKLIEFHCTFDIAPDDSVEDNLCFFSSNNSIEIYRSVEMRDRPFNIENIVFFFEYCLNFFERELEKRKTYDRLLRTYSNKATTIKHSYKDKDGKTDLVLETIEFNYENKKNATISVEWIGGAITRPKYHYSLSECWISKIELT